MNLYIVFQNRLISPEIFLEWIVDCVCFQKCIWDIYEYFGHFCNESKIVFVCFQNRLVYSRHLWNESKILFWNILVASSIHLSNELKTVSFISKQINVFKTFIGQNWRSILNKSMCQLILYIRCWYTKDFYRTYWYIINFFYVSNCILW
jgi:hypothetical protein